MQVRRFTKFSFTTALALAAVHGCGGKSSTPGDGSGASVGDGDGTGANIGDGDGDHVGTGGADAGSGGGTGGIATGGDTSTGGTMPTGGTNGQVLATLGDDCASPGSFACSESNPKLALICDGDGKWASRETCSGDALCDFNAGPNEGTCRVPLEECDDAMPLLCVGADVALCNDGGFDTTVVDECAEGCGNGECVWVADECVEDAQGTTLINCGDDECPGDTGRCSTCGWIVSSSLTTRYIGRTSTEGSCYREACDRDFFDITVASDAEAELPVRFTVGAGWGMVAFDDGSENRTRIHTNCAEVVEGCVILPPSEGNLDNYEYRGVHLVPLSENVVARNLTVETVEPGTTCD